MASELLLKSAFVGVIMAAAVGPIWMLCFRRALAEGFWVGFASGLGAAGADALYAAVAAFGLTFVSDFLIEHRTLFMVGACLFLLWLGAHMFRARPGRPVGPVATIRSSGLVQTCGVTLMLTLANPMTILSFLAIFAGLGLTGARDLATATSMVLGVFLGSTLWWVFLCGLAARIGPRLGDATFVALNRAAGAFVVAFACYQLLLVARG
ncbi:MAG: LysE family transporter [Burkholderiales bacterium]|jgi:threonine/homoserine/homoserine lactone efflux protein|nr:LysE family transporter [Burkholderiales bacterium]